MPLLRSGVDSHRDQITSPPYVVVRHPRSKERRGAPPPPACRGKVRAGRAACLTQIPRKEHEVDDGTGWRRRRRLHYAYGLEGVLIGIWDGGNRGFLGGIGRPVLMQQASGVAVGAVLQLLRPGWLQWQSCNWGTYLNEVSNVCGLKRPRFSVNCLFLSTCRSSIRRMSL